MTFRKFVSFLTQKARSSYIGVKIIDVFSPLSVQSMADSVKDVNPTAPYTNMSKRAQKMMKRLEAKQRRKELKQQNKGLTRNKDPGFDAQLFEQTDYYFENGLRKVYPYHYTFASYVKGRWVGKTALEVFTKDFHGTETEEYIDSIESGKVLVNGKPTSFEYKVKDGDYLEHTLHRHENPVVGSPLEIIADTEDLIVINKPSSIPCHPCGRYRFNSIAFILGKEYGYSNLRNLYRLDRLTSGVLILGKTAKVTRKFEDEIANRQVQKEYVCRVVGEFPEGEVVCEQPLSILNFKVSLIRVDPKGKPSKTIFRRYSYNGKTSVVKCFPLTGRTHQIRVHLQYLGHPIVNDPLYNSPAFGPNRGKGGEFSKSLKEVVEEITKLHNIGLWYDGENHLYNKRLKEIKEGCHKQEMCDKPDIEATDKGCDTCITREEPQSKRIKLESEKDSDIKIMTCNKLEEFSDPVTYQNEGTSCLKEDSDSCEVIVNKDVRSSTCLGRSSKGVEIQYPPFNESKWIPDEKCIDCKRNYIEPTPSHLVIFLHALRYKGSDWEYSTDLPEWAKDDWIDNTCISEEEKK